MLLLRPVTPMATRKITLRNYKFDEKNPSIELTMEATGISRTEAIKIIKELCYRVDYPKKKKKKKAA